MIFRNALVAALLALGFANSAQAGEAEIRQMLVGRVSGAERAEITKSQVPGLYEVVSGGNVFFTTEDGRYLMQGKMYDLQTGTDITEARLDGVRRQAIAQVEDDQTIVFAPKDVKHTITVFTDIDCHYCRELHKEMDGYLAQGIKVRYMFFPRAGISSGSAKKAESVWCAADRNDAMDTAKAQRVVPEASCSNPVAQHYTLGRQMGVRATPTIVTEDGRVIPGFRKPDELIRMLGQQG